MFIAPNFSKMSFDVSNAYLATFLAISEGIQNAHLPPSTRI